CRPRGASRRPRGAPHLGSALAARAPQPGRRVPSPPPGARPRSRSAAPAKLRTAETCESRATSPLEAPSAALLRDVGDHPGVARGGPVRTERAHDLLVVVAAPLQRARDGGKGI